MNDNERKYSRASLSVRTAPTVEMHLALRPRCMAVIARDSIQRPRIDGRKRGFWPLFPEIARAASDHGANVLMFSSWSHDEHSTGHKISKNHLFPRGTQHSAVVLGVRRRDGKSIVEDIEVWHRSRRSPYCLRQHFGKVSNCRASKARLVEDIPEERRFGSTMLLLCGEVNIVRTQRGKSGIVDDFRFLSRLRDLGIELVLNPSHTYMHRPEMALKRQAISRAARSLISVWNRGDPKKGSESKLPWAAYRNGEDIRDEIKEISLPIPLLHGIRMGVLRLA